MFFVVSARRDTREEASRSCALFSHHRENERERKRRERKRDEREREGGGL